MVTGVVRILGCHGFRIWNTTHPQVHIPYVTGYGYWATSKGAALDVNDMCRLQGLDPEFDFPWQLIGKGVTPGATAQCLGNAVNRAVLLSFLPRVLWAASLITSEEYKVVKARASMVLDRLCNRS